MKKSLPASLRMSENDALVIIDMQYYFKNRGINENHPDPESFNEEWDIIAHRIASLVKIAKESSIKIFVLEYEGFSDRETDAIITDAIGDYNRAHFILKNSDSGASEIICDPFIEDINEFFITGVNRGFCVSATARDIARSLNARVTLVDDAIGDEHGDHIDYDFYPYKSECLQRMFLGNTIDNERLSLWKTVA